MKKSLLALAVLGAFAGAASAQSSVTLYGTVDLSAKYVKNDGSDKRLSLSQDGINSSQLGFRGIEDLGGGLKAGFTLLGGVNADTGTANSKFWNRRSTLSLYSNMGELRLGRDYTPTFWNETIYDAFGTNGLGSSLNVAQAYNGTRQDNSIGYFLPSNLGGLYGQAMGALGQGVNGQKYWGGRLGFAAGPFDVNAAYGDTKTNTFVAKNPDFKMWNVGGSYDFGVAKIYGFYNRNTWDPLSQSVYELSLSVPFGQAELRASYGHETASGAVSLNNHHATLYSVEGVYNLSKRTALYATAAKIANSGSAAFSVLPGTASLNLANGNSTGYNVGIRHSF